jgi:hypothetical protein
MIGAKILSFALLQAGWFACVLGAAHGHSWLGPMFVAAALVFHVRSQPRECRAREASVLALTALIGFAVDTALLRAGVMSAMGAEVSPPWLVAMWPNFAAATAGTGSLGSLAHRPILGAVVGAVGAPLSYAAGSGFAVIGLAQNHARALAIIGIAWAGVLPTLFWLRQRSRAWPSARAAQGTPG